MKKLTALFLALCMLFALTACGGGNSEPAATAPPSEAPAATPAPTAESTPSPVEFGVFAAASMTETLTECIELYKGARPM